MHPCYSAQIGLQLSYTETSVSPSWGTRMTGRPISNPVLKFRTYAHFEFHVVYKDHFQLSQNNLLKRLFFPPLKFWHPCQKKCILVYFYILNFILLAHKSSSLSISPRWITIVKFQTGNMSSPQLCSFGMLLAYSSLFLLCV